MKTLDDYLRTKGSKRVIVLAKELAVTPGRVSQLRFATEWPADLALKVEAATDGYLNASKLSVTIAKART